MSIEWPRTLLAPRKVTAEPVYASLAGGLQSVSVELPLDVGAGYWRITYEEIPLASEPQKRAWRAISAQCDGRLNNLAVPIYSDDVPWPGGVIGAPVLVTLAADIAAGQTDISLTLTSCGPLFSGMQFSIAEVLYRIDEVTEVSGSTVVSVWPPVRLPESAGTSVEFVDPRSTVRLETDKEMRTGVDDYAGRTLAKVNFVEAPLVATTPLPGWVLALRAPSGKLPGIILDFANGRYWAAGAVQALGTVVDDDPTFGPWDPAVIVPGLGVPADAALSQQGHVVRAFYGSTWLTAGFTAYIKSIGGPPGFTNATYSSTRQYELDLYERTYVNDGIIHIVAGAPPNMLSGTDYDFTFTPTAASYTQTSPVATNKIRFATNITWPKMAISLEGIAPTDATISAPVSPPTPPLTDIAFGTFGGGVGDGLYLGLVVIYDLQPEADLAMISVL